MERDMLGRLEEAKGLLLGILIGVAMQMRSLELARRGLLGEEAHGVEELQLGASLLSVWALMGFQRQAASAGDPCGQSLGMASLAIGLIRLMRLLNPEGEESAAQEAVALSQPLD